MNQQLEFEEEAGKESSASSGPSRRYLSQHDIRPDGAFQIV